MRNPKRIPGLLNLIYRIWKKYPNTELRLAQLLLNALPEDKEYQDQYRRIYNLEDNELIERLEEFYGESFSPRP